MTPSPLDLTANLCLTVATVLLPVVPKILAMVKEKVKTYPQNPHLTILTLNSKVRTALVSTA